VPLSLSCMCQGGPVRKYEGEEKITDCSASNPGYKSEDFGVDLFLGYHLGVCSGSRRARLVYTSEK
jgi:hypothetical protein